MDRECSLDEMEHYDTDKLEESRDGFGLSSTPTLWERLVQRGYRALPANAIKGLVTGRRLIVLVTLLFLCLVWLSSRTYEPWTALQSLKLEKHSDALDCSVHEVLYKDVINTEAYWEAQGGIQREDLTLSRDVCERDGNCAIVKIFEGQTYVRTPTPLPHAFQTRLESSLLLLLRAGVTDIPNIDFLIDLNDGPRIREACFLEASKHVDALNSTSRETLNHFLLPDFGSFSWWETKLPTFQTARQNFVKTHGDFASKIPKLVWRGTAKLQQGNNRQELVDTLGPRSDVADVATVEINEELKQGSLNHYMSLDQMCRYKYIIYTEGLTYSGRLKYTSLCGSVQVGLAFTYLEFWTHLIKDDLYLKVSSWEEAAQKVQDWESSGSLEPQRIAEETRDRVREQLTQNGLSCYITRVLQGYARSIRWEVLSPSDDVKETGISRSGRPFQFVEIEHYLTELMRYGSLESLEPKVLEPVKL